MYPDTTTFYLGTMSAAPFKSGPSDSPPNKVCCLVQFYDDEDETGVVPKRMLDTRFAFPST